MGTAYNANIVSAGGLQPAGFTVTSGTLPAGLTLASNGALTGTPTAANTFTFTITATDNSTPPQTASQTYTVTIAPGTPLTLVSVNPNTGQQGQQSLSVTITGQSTHFSQGATIADFGSGVHVQSLTVGSPTTATAVLNIDAVPNAGIQLNFFPNSVYSANTAAMDATLGTTAYTIDSFETTALIPGLTIQLSGGVSPTTWTSLPNLFNGDIACPGLTSGQAWDGTDTASNQILNQVTNCSGAPGTANLMTFNYAPGATSFGIGLSNFQSVNPPSPSFPIANHELFVNGVDMGVLETLAGAAWSPGLTRNAYLRIDGTNGGVITSVGIENLSTALGVDFLMFDHLAILPSATAARNVTITTNTEVATFTNGFTVNTNPLAPAIASVSPNTGHQGQQNLSVAITGMSTHFVQGLTTASFGAGITVISLTVNSATNATAVLNINPAAALGARTLTLTTGNETTIFGNGFTVVSPNIGDIRVTQVTYTNSVAPAVVTWTPPFADTNYTAVCTVETQPSDFLLPTITSRSPGSMTVSPTDGGSPAGILNCIAASDSGSSDLRHARVTYSGFPASVDVTWNAPFPDLNYTPVCTAETEGPFSAGFTSAISAES